MAFNFLVDDKKPLHVLGIMSGTSCDGLDFALIEVYMVNSKPIYNVLDTHFKPFDVAMKKRIQSIIIEGKTDLEELTRLLYDLSDLTVYCIGKLKKNYTIDLIGVHGQTVFHNGKDKQTYQLVSSQLISKKSGIPTVSDFRTGDTALGGEGAPLVSFFDYECWNKHEVGQLILNIGGISNGTYLPKNANEENICSFDFGPGNTFIDLAMDKFFKKPYDENGLFAKQGKPNQKLISKWYETENYFKKALPKTTGREYFNIAYFNLLIEDCTKYNLSDYDILSTLTLYTATCIKEQIDYYNMSVNEIMITGGGAYNNTIKDYLASYYTLAETDDETIQFKEAIIFALLAYYFVLKKPANLPLVTGARMKTVLGSFSF